MDFKNYSLSHLKDSLKDAMCSEATPEEVYLTIVNSCVGNISQWLFGTMS